MHKHNYVLNIEIPKITNAKIKIKKKKIGMKLPKLQSAPHPLKKKKQKYYNYIN